MTNRAARTAAAAEALSEALRCLHLLHGPEWASVELSMAQLKTLVLVVSTGGLSGRDLARRLGVGPPAVTALVDRLVQHGYVRREEDAVDRRICWTRPTPAGIALFERVDAAGRERLAEVLSSLADDELALVERALRLLRDAAARSLARVSVPAAGTREHEHG